MCAVAGDLWQNWGTPQWWKLKKGKCATRIIANDYFFSHISEAFSHVQSVLILQVWAVYSLSHGWCQSRNQAHPQCKCQLFWKPSLGRALPAEPSHLMGLCWEVTRGVTVSVTALTWWLITEANPAKSAVPQSSPLCWREPCKSSGKWGWCSAHRELLALSQCVNCCSHN